MSFYYKYIGKIVNKIKKHVINTQMRIYDVFYYE